MFTSLYQVKLNNDYTYIVNTVPTVAEKEPVYLNGETWLDSSTGFSYQLTDQTTGTWVQIELVEDTKINALTADVENIVLRYLSNSFTISRDLKYSETTDFTDFPSTVTRQQAFILEFYVSVYSLFVFDNATSTITVETDSELFGYLTDFAVGETVLITNTKRNNGYFTIAAIGADSITVTETIQDEESYSFIILSDIPDGLITIIARMIHYDVYLRNATKGIKQERIGTYSYTINNSNSSALQYPDDIIAGLVAYEFTPVGGISHFVN
jgi:hypothetical protein